ENERGSERAPKRFEMYPVAAGVVKFRRGAVVSVVSAMVSLEGGKVGGGEKERAPSPHSCVRQRRTQWDLERQFSEASCPPEAVMRGLTAAVMALDKRSWLEVRDPLHRYGKNLREYYEAWQELGKPGRSFFQWLDVSSFELMSCPRDRLEADTVQYLTTEEERRLYAVALAEGNRVVV
ncbi:unnamed protein product, partial [Phaeothamnion confervicola]